MKTEESSARELSSTRLAEPAMGLSTTRRILLVDDEPSVRRVGEKALHRAGFEVLLAENGQRALEVYGQHGPGIELVILDMSMPGMGGLETFAGLKALNANVRVLLSSGYDTVEASAACSHGGPMGVLQKPYRVAALLEQVTAALNAPAC